MPLNTQPKKRRTINDLIFDLWDIAQTMSMHDGKQYDVIREAIDVLDDYSVLARHLAKAVVIND